MEVYEKINLIIKTKEITKRAFAKILRNLEPKLKSTGEIPSEKTIYKYLSGDISIPIELIPYIAEALDVVEQELFTLHPQSKRKLIKYLSTELDSTQISYIKSSQKNVINTKIIEPVHKEEVEKIIQLLEFTPLAMLNKIIKRIEEIKEIVHKPL